MKNNSEYPKDAGVATPWQPLGIPFATTPLGQLHQALPSPIPGDLVTGKRSQLPVDMLEHRDTYGQAQVCSNSRHGSSMAHSKRRGCSIQIFIFKHDFFRFLRVEPGSTRLALEFSILRVFGWCQTGHFGVFPSCQHRIEPAQLDF